MSSSSPLDEGIRVLQTDKTNGARILATNAVKALLDILLHASKTSNGARDLWASMRHAGRALRDARPSMGAAIGAAVVNALDALRQAWAREFGAGWMERKGGDDLAGMVEVGRKVLEDAVRGREESVEKIARAFSTWIKGVHEEVVKQGRQGPLKILTLSDSSTVRACLVDALKRVNGLKVLLRILESRPRCEGVGLGRKLLAVDDEEEHGKLRIEVAPDCAVAMLAKDVDVVLLGADRISGAGDVSNKIGSLPAAICAKTLSEKVMVVAISETDKIARPGAMEEHGDEENEPEEVMKAWDEASTTFVSESFRVRNVYFEWVPSRWVDAYISEIGVIETGDVQKLSRRIMELEDSILNAFEA